MQCPDSQHFIVGSLAPAWNTDGFRDIVDISLIPWGHGKIADSSSDTDSPSLWCQHGSNECLAQRITACVATLGSSDQTVDFVIDLATKMIGGSCDDPTEMAEDIVDTLGLSDLPNTKRHHAVTVNVAAKHIKCCIALKHYDVIASSMKAS